MAKRVSDQKYPCTSIQLQTISNSAFTKHAYQRLLYKSAHRKIMQMECVRTDNVEVKMYPDKEKEEGLTQQSKYEAFKCQLDLG